MSERDQFAPVALSNQVAQLVGLLVFGGLAMLFVLAVGGRFCFVAVTRIAAFALLLLVSLSIRCGDYVAITYELIHDTRIILDSSSPREPTLSSGIRLYMGAARGHWEGATLVVENKNLKANTRGSSPGLRLTERFARTGRDSIEYRVTFIDPTT